MASAAASTNAVPRHAAPDAAADALVAELRAVIADLRQDRDQWREQAQRLALPAAVRAEAPDAWPPPSYRRPGSVAPPPHLALAAVDGVGRG